MYPEELLEAMCVGDVFAWRTGGEGEHSITFAHLESGLESSAAAVRGFVRLADGDRLLLMPYSQYSYGCSSKGKFNFIDGLCAVVSTQTGRLEVSVVLLGSGLPLISGSRFGVSLAHGTAQFDDRKELPGWDDSHKRQ